MKVKSILLNLVLALGGLGIACAALEGYAYLRLHKPAAPDTQKNSVYYLRKILLPYPQLTADYFRMDEICTRHYYDYYLISFDCKSKTLNTTDYYSSRSVPDSAPIGTTHPIIWIFGGSTMLNLTSPDELTIANHLARTWRDAGTPATVVNFGMGAFSSAQERVKLNDIIARVPQNEVPDLVIFYDGFNDAGDSYTFGPGNFQEDLNTKVRFLIEGHGDWLWPLLFSSYMQERSLFWKSFVAPRIAGTFTERMVSARGKTFTDYRAAVSYYEQNAKVVRAVASTFKAKTLFVLQPMIFTKQPLSAFERDVMTDVVEQNKPHLEFMLNWYATAREVMGKYPDFVDLTGLLNGRTTDDFFDHGHTGPVTSEPIGRALGRESMKALGVQVVAVADRKLQP